MFEYKHGNKSWQLTCADKRDNFFVLCDALNSEKQRGPLLWVRKGQSKSKKQELEREREIKKKEREELSRGRCSRGDNYERDGVDVEMADICFIQNKATTLTNFPIRVRCLHPFYSPPPTIVHFFRCCLD